MNCLGSTVVVEKGPLGEGLKVWTTRQVMVTLGEVGRTRRGGATAKDGRGSVLFLAAMV